MNMKQMAFDYSIRIAEIVKHLRSDDKTYTRRKHKMIFFKRTGALIIALSILCSLAPGLSFSVMADVSQDTAYELTDLEADELLLSSAGESESIILTFVPLPYDLQAQTVTAGTPVDALGLPDTLYAEVQTPDGSEERAIPVSEWYTPAGYNAQEGKYTLIPRFKERYLLGPDAVTPVVWLTVKPVFQMLFSWSGVGSTVNPLEINSHEALRDFTARYNDGTLHTMLNIEQDSKIYVKLTDNIDLSSYSAWSGWTPIGTRERPFYGEFDGDGWVIRALTILKAGGNSGLFGFVAQGSVIQNLGLLGAYVEGADNSGIIAGELSGTIRNCYTGGTALAMDAHPDHAEGEHLAGHIGGIAGHVTGSGLIDGVHTTATVSVTDDSRYLTDFGKTYAGGIAGKSSGTIQNCVALNPYINAEHKYSIVAENLKGTYLNVYKTCLPKDSSTNSPYGYLLGKPSDYDTWPQALKSAPWSVAEVKNDDGMVAYLPYLLGADGTMRNKPYLPAHISGFDDGDGTPDNPFVISEPAHLEYISTILSARQGDFKGQYFELAKDIDLLNEVLTPLGTYENPFCGNFDGKGYAIQNMKIIRTHMSYVGLFGKVSGATIRNLGIESAEIEGFFQVGGIAGAATGGSLIERCYISDSTITVEGIEVGGISGYVQSSTIRECYASDLIITANGFLGGIAGSMSGRIESCYTKGTMTVLSAMASGGIVGLLRGDINYCYSTMGITHDVTSLKRTLLTAGYGGIAGAFVDGGGAIENSVALNKEIKGSKGAIDRIYPSKSGTGFNGNVSWRLMPLNNFNVPDREAPYRGEGKLLDDLHKKDAWENMMSMPDSPWEWVEGETPILKHTGGAQSNPVPEWEEKLLVEEITPVNSGKDYHIKKAAHLAWVALEVNEGNMKLEPGDEPKTFYLDNDIDLSDYRDNGGWMGIGALGTPFHHNFDGQGHKITGLYAYRGSAVGLFGRVSAGNYYSEFDVHQKGYNENYIPSNIPHIQNVGVEDCELYGRVAGGIVADIFSGRISNCWVTGKIGAIPAATATGSVGGIAGGLLYSSVTGCWNGADLSARHDVNATLGGIAGTAGSVLNRYDCLFHSASAVLNCYNTGAITAMRSGTAYAGGIVGLSTHRIIYNSTELRSNPMQIIGCYSTGKISTPNRAKDKIGGIVGYADVTLSHEECPFTDKIESVKISSCAVLSPPPEIGGEGEIKYNTIFGGQEIRDYYGHDIDGGTCIYWDGFGVASTSTPMGLPYTKEDFNTKEGKGPLFFALNGFAAGFWEFSPIKEENAPILKNLTDAPQSDLLPMHLRKGGGGDYVQGSTFYIKSYAELEELRRAVLDGEDTSYNVSLEADITLNDSWPGIGTEAKPFVGTFKGNGHTITNLRQEVSTNIGLFGVAKDVAISDLCVEVDAVNIPGAAKANAGGLIGKLYNSDDVSTIKNCMVVPMPGKGGTITSDSGNAGGLIGAIVRDANSADKRITIENCHTSVSVRAADNAGGLVGFFDGDGKTLDPIINNCYTLGGVTATIGNAGGILGGFTKASNSYTISHCYALNRFVNGKLSGMVAGIEQDADKIGGIVISNTRVWSNMAIPDRAIDSSLPTGTSTVTAEALRTSTSFEGTWYNTEGELPVPGSFAKIKSRPIPDFMRELEEKNGVYQISMWQELELVNQYLKDNSYKHTFGNYQLTGDFSLDQFGTIGSIPEGGMDDSAECAMGYFRGTLDGGGRTLSGSNSPLFAALGKGAQVSNLTLSDVNIIGTDNVGALTGVAAQGAAASNIQISGSITGKNNVGALFGQSAAQAEQITSSARVEGESNVGGIVGLLLNNASITDSHLEAAANVKGKTNTGGLAGTAESGGSIVSSYSLAPVEGDEYTGGLVGLLGGAISKGYMSGSLHGTIYLGGIAGKMENSASITDVYSTSTLEGAMYVGGIVGMLINATISGAFSLGGIDAKANYAGGIAGIAKGGSLSGCAALNPYVRSGNAATGHRVVGSSTDMVLENNLAFSGMTGTFSPGENDLNGKNAEKLALWDNQLWKDNAAFDTAAIWELFELPFPLLADLKDQTNLAPSHLEGFAVGEDLALELTWEDAQDVLKAAERTLAFTTQLQNAEAVTQTEVRWNIESSDGSDISEITFSLLGDANQIDVPATYTGRFTVTAALQNNSAIADSVNVLVVHNMASPFVDGDNTPEGSYATIGAVTVTANLAEAYFEGGADMEITASIADKTATALATANQDIIFTFKASDMNTLPFGVYDICISCEGDSSNNPIESTKVGTLTVNKATPVITTMPAAGNIYKGALLSESALTGGVASTTGLFAWKNGSHLPIQSGSYDITFTATDVNYNQIEDAVSLTIIDREALGIVIADANAILTTAVAGMGNGQYPPKSYNTFIRTIAAAEAVYNAAAASNTQAAIDDAAAALQDAIDPFKASLVCVDYTVLAAKIIEAKAISRGNYTLASWQALQSAIVGAEDMRTAQISTQEETDRAVRALTGAIAGLSTNVSGGGTTTRYLVTFHTEGGSEVTAQAVAHNAKAIRPTDPAKEGFIFAGWFTDQELAAEYDFDAAVSSHIDLYAKWATDDTRKLPFTDVTAGDWFYNDVYYVWENDLFKGTSDTVFSPNAPITRAMLVTVLWRAAGSPAAVNMPFTDVASDTYYYDAVAWASANGIIEGIGGGLFDPDADVTREQMAAILFRYLEFIEHEYVVTAEYRIFADEDEISNYAKNAVQILNKLGIINGKSGNAIDPKGSATRAEVAAMLHRLLELK